jgi:hypothetical protein
MEIERLRRVLCGMLLLEVFPVFPKQPLFRVKKLTGKCKKINWTPNAWLNSISHHTGFSTSEAFNMPKVQQDWISHNCQFLGLDIPHLKEFQHHECPCKRFAIDTLSDNRTAARNTLESRRAHTTFSQLCNGCSQGGIQNRTQERATQPQTEEDRPLD